MRRKKGFERPRQFKCCANTTGQGLRLRRNPFPRSRNTIETECMHRGRRIGAYEESPWAFPPNPCLGRGPLENHPALEKGRCPAAFFFLQMAPWRPTLSSRCLVVSPRPSQLYQGQKRRTDRRKSYSAVVLHWCAVNERSATPVTWEHSPATEPLRHSMPWIAPIPARPRTPPSLIWICWRAYSTWRV